MADSATHRIPWLRVFVEGVVIVGSILLAFGIDAWWDSVNRAEEEARLLSDLAEEFEGNRDRLEAATGRHRARIERLSTLIREAGPEREGLSPDSLNTLARRALVNPVFAVETGVMERAVAGNGLSVIGDSDLRADIAGFWNRFEFYFNNQKKIGNEVIYSAPVAFETGTLVWQDFPRYESLGPTTMWSDPLTPDEANALKYFSIAQFMSELLVRQGEGMLAAIDSMVVYLNQAKAR